MSFRTVNMLIRYDEERYKEDPSTSVFFSITDDDGNPLHEGIDLSSLTDEDLIIVASSLSSVLENVINDEFDKRNSYNDEIRNEIEKVIINLPNGDKKK